MPSLITRGGGSIKSFGFISSPQRFINVTYSVSSVYTSNNSPTYQYMNNNSANGASNNSEWGSAFESDPFITADLGTIKTVNKIVIGYDYLDNLAPGSWGTGYSEGLDIETAISPIDFFYQSTTPSYSSTGSTNGLVTIPMGNISAQFVRLIAYSSSYACILEFQIWGY